MKILFTYRANKCIWITSFDQYLDNQVGFLAVGNLVAEDDLGAPVTLDGYVIDWYLNSVSGDPEFTSSGGTEHYGAPHPFYIVGQRLYVAPGTWYPVIRYVVVDGKEYYHKDGDEYCELISLTVQAVTCSNGGALTYSHSFAYNYVTYKNELATQTIDLILESDGSTAYVAYAFYGYTIPDKLRVTYISPLNVTETVIEIYAVGIGDPSDPFDYGINYVYDPIDEEWLYEYRDPISPTGTTQLMKKVIDLSGFTYASGDFVRFEVIPSYRSSIEDTNWRLDLKCLDSSAFNNCAAFFPNTYNDIDPTTCVMTWNATDCRYEFTASMDDYWPTSYAEENLYKYLSLNAATTYHGPSASNSIADGNVNINLESAYRSSDLGGIQYNTACVASDGLISIDYTNATHTLVYSFDANGNEYTKWKDNISACITHSVFLDYSSDPDDPNHYNYIRLASLRIDSILPGCSGDNFFTYSHYLAYNPAATDKLDVTFDDINKTITIVLIQITDDYTPSGCDTDVDTSLQQIVTNVNSAYNRADFSYTTYASSVTPYGCYKPRIYLSSITERYCSYYARLIKMFVDEICSLPSEWCPVTFNGADIYFWYKHNSRLVIDDPTTEVTAVNNYTLYSQIGSDGCLDGYWTCIYKIVDGVDNLCDDELRKFKMTLVLSSAGEVVIPLTSFYGTIDWGDTTEEELYSVSNPSHEYASAGTYYVEIFGKGSGLYANNSSSFKSALVAITQWGELELSSLEFRGCTNLSSIPSSPLTLKSRTQTSFTNLFYDCTSITSVPSTLFDNYPLITNFSSAFRGSGLTSVPSGLFDNNPLANNFQYCFYLCASLTTVGSGLFDNLTNLSAYTSGSFRYLFYHCTALTTIPSKLFYYNTDAGNQAFGYTFAYCSSLTSVPADIFPSVCNATTDVLTGVFSYCGLTSIPSGLLDGFINVTSMNQIFYDCNGLTSIPSGLFDNNTEVLSFYSTFNSCDSLTSIPTDLFRYNTLVTTFQQCFCWCASLVTIPSGLFKYNLQAVSFYYLVGYALNLQLVSDLFCDSGDEDIRFYNQSVDFTYFIYRNGTFTGVQGTAPALWDYDYGSGTPTSTHAFYGTANNLTSLSNYADIPAEWK